jgi:hypothetical protein
MRNRSIGSVSKIWPHSNAAKKPDQSEATARRSAPTSRRGRGGSPESSADCATLRDLLAKDADGQRSCIPVFGTGLNIQAATLAGYPHKDDWRELLAKIGARVLPPGRSIDSLPRDQLALWETLLCLWAKKIARYPFKAENELQHLICEELRAQEADSRSFALYRQIVNAGFRDILSLNFDRRIAQSGVKGSFDSGPSPSPLGSHGESIFRHSVVPLESGAPTRVWYPHGDVKKAATIKFGVRKYGFYVAVLREYVFGRDGAWRYHSSSRQHLADAEVKANLLHEAPAWVPLFLTRPLLFIGCGLSPQEWPLWWLLRHRLKRGTAPAVCLAISSSGIPPHLRSLPEVRTIAFDHPNDLWATFLGALSQDAGASR